MLGAPRDVLVKRSIDALWPEVPDWADLLAYFRETGSVYDVTVSLTSKAGNPIECVASGSVMRTRAGHVRNYSLVLRDVTLQRRLERELRDRQRTDDVGNLAVGIAPNQSAITDNLNNSWMLGTALNTHIGYDKAPALANKAHKEGSTLKEAAVALGHLTEEEFDKVVVPEQMVGNR